MNTLKMSIAIFVSLLFAIPAVNAQVSADLAAKAKSHRLRGDAYQNAKEYFKAAIEYGKAIEIDPNDAEAWQHRGISNVLMAYGEDAVRDLTKAMEYKPNNPDLYYWRGRARITSDTPAAIADFDKAISLLKHWEYHHYRAQAYIYVRKYELAISDLTFAIDHYLDLAGDMKVTPREARKIILRYLLPESYNLRAVAYDSLDKYDLAVADFTAAAEVGPDQATYYYSKLAYIHEKKNRYDLAAAVYTKMIELSPSGKSYYSDRAYAHCKAGNKTAALQDEDKAKQLGAKIQTPCR